MKKILIALTLFSFSHLAAGNTCQNTKQAENNISIIKNMFTQFSEKKDITQFYNYYAPNFELESNGQKFNCQQYYNLEKNIFTTIKKLKVVSYDDIFATNNKVATRMVIRILKNDNSVNQFQVILIAAIKDNKITHIWEMTNPGWSDKLGK